MLTTSKLSDMDPRTLARLGMHDRHTELGTKLGETGRVRPPRSALGTGLQPRQPAATVTIDDEAEPVGTADIQAEDDVPEAEDEADDDIEIDPDLAKTAD